MEALSAVFSQKRTHYNYENFTNCSTFSFPSIFTKTLSTIYSPLKGAFHSIKQLYEWVEKNPDDVFFMRKLLSASIITWAITSFNLYYLPFKEKRILDDLIGLSSYNPEGVLTTTKATLELAIKISLVLSASFPILFFLIKGPHAQKPTQSIEHLLEKFTELQKEKTAFDPSSLQKIKDLTTALKASLSKKNPPNIKRRKNSLFALVKSLPLTSFERVKKLARSWLPQALPLRLLASKRRKRADVQGSFSLEKIPEIKRIAPSGKVPQSNFFTQELLEEAEKETKVPLPKILNPVKSTFERLVLPPFLKTIFQKNRVDFPAQKQLTFSEKKEAPIPISPEKSASIIPPQCTSTEMLIFPLPEDEKKHLSPS